MSGGLGKTSSNSLHHSPRSISNTSATPSSLQEIGSMQSFAALAQQLAVARHLFCGPACVPELTLLARICFPTANLISAHAHYRSAFLGESALVEFLHHSIRLTGCCTGAPLIGSSTSDTLLCDAPATTITHRSHISSASTPEK